MFCKHNVQLLSKTAVEYLIRQYKHAQNKTGVNHIQQ